MQLNQHTLSAIVVAGGTGSRMQQALPKQFALLAGEPILVHTLRTLLSFKPAIQTLVLVMHPDYLDHWRALAPQYLSAGDMARIHLVAGGETRTQSVWHGLELVTQRHSPGGKTEHSLVAIQDGVRPLLTTHLLRACYDSAAKRGSGVAAVPVKSSLRRVTPQGSSAVDRSEYFAVQTPQTFRLAQVLDAYRKLHDDPAGYTDDASLVEAAGFAVHLCPGSYENLKITSPADLEVAEQILRKRAED
ncbi:MAG: 2-C-methyl-D-erythritol 4-phosphate cytidylyltransferase [Bacteroidetes bacterium]|nr:2-C-methyl-D-erythritol 4-phosphate cytidylyltransferase [Bacteroidota bacterium]